MSKKTAFDKTREVLALPEREYTLAIQSSFNIVVKKAHPSFYTRASNFISNHNLNLKQTEAMISALIENDKIEDDQLMVRSGVGVVITKEQLEQGLADILTPELEKFRALSQISQKFPFADGILLKSVVEQAFEGRIVQKKIVEKQDKPKDAKKAAVPTGMTLEPLDVVYSIIPQKNRYEQLPAEQQKHEQFLKSLGVNLLMRFPPEPNGYLHIGHAKSMFINFGYAKLNGGLTYLRLDDTNPETECDEYVKSIMETVSWLGNTPFQVTHASDHFQRLYDIAEDLIKKGHCYIDDQKAEEISDFRERRIDPPNRNRPAMESLSLFRMMRAGVFPEGSLTLRMKMNMQSDNPNMRDPIAYRIKYHAHQMSGDSWCIYPSYDYTHCLCDAFENITHSICTIEFNIRRESYDWLTHIVGGYRPMQWEFSRLNITYTVMSKRRLLILVKDNLVSGWSDPRMPTLVGLRRRGFTPTIINTFCQAIGVSRNPQTIEYSLLEHVARQEFEREADRAMAVVDPIRVEIIDWVEKSIDYPLHPALTERGIEKIKLSKVIFIERVDFSETQAAQGFYGFAPDQPCALRYGPNLYMKEIVKGKNGQISVKASFSEDVEATKQLMRDMKLKKKTLPRLHWISENDSRVAEVRLYDVLFKSKDPMAVEDWLSDINPKSIVIQANARVPRYVADSCKDGKSYKHYQFERQGFFVVDEESTNKKPILNLTVALKKDYE
ncbi:Glutaminyl-tRNA synthetase [Spironucleus salmonicida]|uniref:glutamine--tRNA ligase n=1 Tax=Spironucleus salmonicida TaxID=348837 RepID=V6LCI5_9EUKA|nr:Glutaminyl-tRNA synthetase [Spironucleus salmonicida]|eukprot:EST42157.1 Glutaminyl-tRNA synthetase [Spironucleus salmonicida]